MLHTPLSLGLRCSTPLPSQSSVLRREKVAVFRSVLHVSVDGVYTSVASILLHASVARHTPLFCCRCAAFEPYPRPF